MAVAVAHHVAAVMVVAHAVPPVMAMAHAMTTMAVAVVHPDVDDVGGGIDDADHAGSGRGGRGDADGSERGQGGDCEKRLPHGGLPHPMLVARTRTPAMSRTAGPGT